MKFFIKIIFNKLNHLLEYFLLYFQILSHFSDRGEERVSFSNVVQNCEVKEVPRYFLSCLMLVSIIYINLRCITNCIFKNLDDIVIPYILIYIVIFLVLINF